VPAERKWRGLEEEQTEGIGGERSSLVVGWLAARVFHRGRSFLYQAVKKSNGRDSRGGTIRRPVKSDLPGSELGWHQLYL
jgi:hypothetical protein